MTLSQLSFFDLDGTLVDSSIGIQMPLPIPLRSWGT